MLRIAMVSIGLALCASGAVAQEPPARPRLGGAAAVDMNRVDVVEATEFAVAQLEEQLGFTPEVKELTAKLQVVAGTNYLFHLVLDGGDVYDITVNRSLQNELSLVDFKKAD